jgi:hypothetical protein
VDKKESGYYVHSRCHCNGSSWCLWWVVHGSLAERSRVGRESLHQDGKHIKRAGYCSRVPCDGSRVAEPCHDGGNECQGGFGMHCCWKECVVSERSSVLMVAGLLGASERLGAQTSGDLEMNEAK